MKIQFFQTFLAKLFFIFGNVFLWKMVLRQEGKWKRISLKRCARNLEDAIDFSSNPRSENNFKRRKNNHQICYYIKGSYYLFPLFIIFL